MQDDWILSYYFPMFGRKAHRRPPPGEAGEISIQHSGGRRRESFAVFDQAVAAVVALIDHGEAAIGLFIAEGEEIMLQQVHLQDGLLAGHGLDVKALGADDLELGFLSLQRGDL